jgi:hypothetical protein
LIFYAQESPLDPPKGIGQLAGQKRSNTLLPAGAQRVTTFAAGNPATSTYPEAAKGLIEWLPSSAAYAAIKKNSLVPENSK